MNIPSRRAMVTFDPNALLRGIAAYRKGVAEGDSHGTLSMDAGLEVFVDGTSHEGGFHMVACDHNGEPVSVLVQLFPNNEEMPQKELLVVFTRDFRAVDAWDVQQLVYVDEDPGSNGTGVLWVKQSR